MENEIQLTEKLAPYQDTAENMLSQVIRAELSNMEDCSKLGDLAKMAKTQFKKLEDERKAWVKPLNDQVKKLNELFKAQQEPFVEIEKIAKDTIGAFMREEEKRQEKVRKRDREKAEAEAMAAAEKASSSGNEAEADAILEESIEAGDKVPDKQIARGDFGSTSSVRKVWKHKILDPGLVPRRYMMVDESVVKAAVKNGVREIPGIEIMEERSVVIR